MALYRVGDTGEPVRDIQGRLDALGHDTSDDGPSVFGDATHGAVVAFQRARNLPPDGVVDDETWRTLVDAGYRAGDRLLYYRFPMLHGDDVAQLQRELNALGFEVGPVDGIFGSETLAAVLDFQKNRHLPEDGIAGPRVVEELSLMTRATRKQGRDAVRERVWLDALPRTVAGQRVFLDAFCRDEHEADATWDAVSTAAMELRDSGAHTVLSRSADTRPGEAARATRANEVAADMVIAFALPMTDDPGIYYFESTISRSEAGMAFASVIGSRLGVKPLGRMMPILRSTRAPAIVVSVPRLDRALGSAVARGVERWLADRAE